MLASDGAPTHVDWVLAEAGMKGFTSLLSTLWQETQPLISDLLFMVWHNSREKQDLVY